MKRSVVEGYLRRPFVRRLWVLGNLGYSLLRILLARHFLASHGLNVWMFAAVELTSSIPWSVGSARVVGALVAGERRLATSWAVVAGVGFLAPDAYALATSDRLPPWLMFTIILLTVTTAAVMIRKIPAQVRAMRALKPAVVGR